MYGISCINHIMYTLYNRFLLLKNPNPEQIDILNSKMNGNITNTSNNETLGIELVSKFNSTDRNDNPFSYFPTSIDAVYFWINGNWTQRDKFDFWAVRAFSILASVFIVTLLQNLLIAFMR